MTQELLDLRTSILEGRYPEALAISQFKLAALVNRPQIIETVVTLLNLTYSHTPKELPTAIPNIFAQLPGGQEWIKRPK